MINSDNPEWWTEEKIARYFGDGTIAAAHFRAFVAQVSQLRQELDDARQWEDVEYNDIINVDNNNQLRVVINCDNPDGKVHLHIRKRVNGEWRHAGITTLLSNFRLQRKRTESEGE